MEPKQQPPYPLRMPSDMRSHYEDLAEQSKRSLNAEIVAALGEAQELRNRVESLTNELLEMRRHSERLAGEQQLATKQLAFATSNGEQLQRQLQTQETITNTLAQLFQSYNQLSTPRPGMALLCNHLLEIARTASTGDDAAVMAALKSADAGFAGFSAGLRDGILERERAAAESVGADEQLARKRLVGNLGSDRKSKHATEVARPTRSQSRKTPKS